MTISLNRKLVSYFMRTSVIIYTDLKIDETHIYSTGTSVKFRKKLVTNREPV